MMVASFLLTSLLLSSYKKISYSVGTEIIQLGLQNPTNNMDF